MRAHAHARSAQRRGFLIISILVLMMIVVTMTAVMLRSSTARNAVIEQQIGGYQDHHDMLSVRHIALRWMSRGRGFEALEEIAGDPRSLAPAPVVYRAELPDGLRVEISVERGQGLLQRDLDGADTATQRALLQTALDTLALTGETDEYTRNVGPMRLMLGTVPDPLIDAIAGTRREIAAGLRRARDAGEYSPGEIQHRLIEFGVEQQLAIDIASELFTTQTRLWKLTAHVEREGNRRRIALYMMQEGDQNIRTWKILEARDLPPVTDNEARAGLAPTRSGRVR